MRTVLICVTIVSGVILLSSGYGRLSDSVYRYPWREPNYVYLDSPIDIAGPEMMRDYVDVYWYNDDANEEIVWWDGYDDDLADPVFVLADPCDANRYSDPSIAGYSDRY